MNVDALNDYAYGKLKLALEYNAFHLFILGVQPYGVRVPAYSSSEKEECIFAKMHAIYKYYNDFPDECINVKLFNLLTKDAPRIKGDYAFITVLRTIEYQILAEKEGRAPFSFDCQGLVELLKKNLQENKALYTSEVYQQVHFMETIKEHHKALANYGYSLM